MHLRHINELTGQVIARSYSNDNWTLKAISVVITDGRIQSVKSIFSSDKNDTGASVPSSQDWTIAEIRELQSLCELAIKGLH